MASSGAALVGLISDLKGGGTGESIVGVDLSTLTGQDTDYAIEQIAAALTPHDGDADKVRRALTRALSDALQGVDQFDPTAIADDMIVTTLVIYLRECVFTQIVMDSSRAFQKSDDANKVIDAENALHSLVAVVVDKHMRRLLDANRGSLTQDAVRRIQLDALKEVWLEWGNY